MAKQAKRTKGDQYAEALESEGARLQDCRIFGFSFSSEERQHIFHFYLMDSEIKYLLYDGMNQKANIIMKPDKQGEQDLRKLAERLSGKEYNPDLKVKI